MTRLAPITLCCIAVIAQVAATNASDTALRFEGRLADRFGPLWYRSMQQHAKELPPGTVRLRLTLSAEGRLLLTQVLSNTSSELAAQIAVHAVQHAKLLPVPKELLRNGVFRPEYSFTVFEYRRKT